MYEFCEAQPYVGNRDQTLCHTHEETGLSRSISRPLAELHGRTVAIEFEAGVRNTMTVRFRSEGLN